MAAWRHPEGAASSGSVKNVDATRAWEVVKLSRLPTNVPLMKTRRSDGGNGLHVWTHACRRAALEALVEMGMAVGGRKGMASRVLGGLTMVDMASSVIDGRTGRKVQVQCRWVGMKHPK